ncbi:hypothetical protein [Pseudomonas moorei]|uniref:hypothetical protein n=1 Tax=Pseudomonas moorei TaxID=395599 RepID=UPI001243B151|nr:hypothetical protein [Pseudomonas moorei]KAB0507747.1 hypothetical protein F7R06_06230 [Pseudomonas moorei]
MNRCMLGLITLALSGFIIPAVQAHVAGSGAPMQIAQNLPGSNNNPYNSPIRRANPNSMQGTQPSAPAVRGPNTVPVPRPPTLDNGGVGNRYPQDRPAPPPPPKFISNPPQRDPDARNP